MLRPLNYRILLAIANVLRQETDKLNKLIEIIYMAICEEEQQTWPSTSLTMKGSVSARTEKAVKEKRL